MDTTTRQLIASTQVKVDASKAATQATGTHIIGYDEYKRIFSSAAQPSETDLIRDILYVLQGIDGRMIKYDRSTDAFMPDKTVITGRDYRVPFFFFS